MKKEKKDFKIYDAIMIEDKPDLTDYGLSRLNMIYEDSLLSFSSNKIPNDRVIDTKKINRQYLKIDEKYPICLDVESWLLDRNNVEKSVPKYTNLLKLFKKKYPNTAIGYYGVIPYADINIYQDIAPFILRKSKKWMEDWYYINSKLGDIAELSTVAYPSCYTRYKDETLWMKAFSIQIDQIKKINPKLKIYVFIWPQYYSQGFGYNNQEVDKNFWKKQLETIYANADGIVIWHPPFNLSNRKTIYWNENAEWWKVTKNFIKNHSIKNNL